jgi:A/G-specific adenine glycosylase
MMKTSDFISSRLQIWYEKNKRDLPWRNTSDPYLIWISEVILQQTRVNQGYDYFVRFIRRFPDIHSLASASEQEVLKLWQGLGYYSRARNLHFAAQQVENDFDGVFPNNFEQIRSLKGVGDYTAAAIASFAFGLSHAAIDGNVCRVISRLFEVEQPVNSTEGKKLIQHIATQLLDDVHPALHNQAMMELGATICLPKHPKCDLCPLESICLASGHHSVENFPIKISKNKIRTRFFNYLHIIHGKETFFRKRTEDDIWKNLYELPLIETSKKVSLIEISNDELFKKWFSKIHSIHFKHVLSIKHILTHQCIFAEFYSIEVPESINFSLPMPYIKIPIEKTDQYPISQLMHKYLERFFSE